MEADLTCLLSQRLVFCVKSLSISSKVVNTNLASSPPQEAFDDLLLELANHPLSDQADTSHRLHYWKQLIELVVKAGRTSRNLSSDIFHWQSTTFDRLSWNFQCLYRFSFQLLLQVFLGLRRDILGKFRWKVQNCHQFIVSAYFLVRQLWHHLMTFRIRSNTSLPWNHRSSRYRQSRLRNSLERFKTRLQWNDSIFQDYEPQFSQARALISLSLFKARLLSPLI